MIPTPSLSDWAAQSPLHLTDEQIHFFDTNGYLILRQWIPAALLARLQAAGRYWMDQGLASDEQDPLHEDYRYATRSNGQQVFFRVDYVHAHQQVASLELLGSPQVLAVAESLCGPNFVPTYESMVFKQEEDGAAVPWHQDAVHPRGSRIFNFDLYLDQSTHGNGALWVVPGSQQQPQDVCAVADQYGWQVPGAIEVDMEPGDVLLHDVMVVHGSPQVAGNTLRRTIYYEFRAAEEIVTDGPWDRAWIDRRMRLIPLGLQRYQQAFPAVPLFTWNASAEFRPELTGDEAAELKVIHGVHMPGSYCSAGDAGK